MSQASTINQTQVVFTIDSNLKEKVLKKVKKEGVTLKGAITMLIKAYLNNEVVLGAHAPSKEKPSEFLIQAIKEAEEDLKEGRVSPTFDNAKQAIQWIHDKNKKYENQV